VPLAPTANDEHNDKAWGGIHTQELLNELGAIVKPHPTAKKPSIVGGRTQPANDARSCISLNPNPFTAMRVVEERSLSSILRSKLLTTLINNDVSGKVNVRGWERALDKF
jgi:hypothetical protein